MITYTKLYKGLMKNRENDALARLYKKNNWEELKEGL